MQLLPPFTEGFGYGLDLRARPIPGRGVTCQLLSGARTRCNLRRRGDSARHSERHLSFVQVMDMMQEEPDYPCAAPGADPPQLSRPRPAAARGEEKRRLSAGEEEFRRGASAPAQSSAKRAQAKAAQADPVRLSPAPPACLPAQLCAGESNGALIPPVGHANDSFQLIEKTIKLYRTHRDAGRFDARFIRDSVESV
eukprot:COSAG01_NODE_4741_length_4773_cov_31.477963_4_plen_196_part_00